MMKSDLLKEELKRLIKDQFCEPINSLKSFQKLSDETGLSVQTLRRFFGKIDPNRKSSITTLSILSRYCGYQDWEDFVTNSAKKNKLQASDKLKIDSMEVFFHNGEKYDTPYFQNTITADTLNDYAQIIYASRANFEYFYSTYQNNLWATDYILAWIPNYNFFAHNWFREILFEYYNITKSISVQLVLCNLIKFGEYLSLEKDTESISIAQLEQLHEDCKAEKGYLPYHEMRYTTNLLFHDKRNNDGRNFKNILFDFLIELEQQNLPKFNICEIKVFLCNSLIWLKEYELAYSILQEIESFFIKEMYNTEDYQSLHYYGLNIPFIKKTFSILWLLNNDQNIERFRLDVNDKNDKNSFLFDNYNSLLLLIDGFLHTNGNALKIQLKSELSEIVESTNIQIVRSLFLK